MLSTYLITLAPQATALGISEEEFFNQELLKYSNGGDATVVNDILALATTAGDTAVINQVQDLKDAMENIQAGGGGGASQQYVDDAIAALTKSSVGLGNVDNTADADKPISDDTQAALDDKEDTGVAAGLIAALTKSSVGLGNVDNTSDANKPISSDTQDALDDKEDVGVADGLVTAHNSSGSAHPGLFATKEDTGVADTQIGAHNVSGGAHSTLFGEKENVANKDTDITLAADSDTKYPSQKAVKAYVDNNSGAGATSSNTPNTIVKRDNNGDFVAQNIYAVGGLKSGVFNADKFTAYDAAGIITSLPEIGYDPAMFNGLNLNYTAVPGSTQNIKKLNNINISFNPTVSDSKESWDGLWLEVGAGTDSSGNQLGDYVDIKSLLVVQDITFTSKRYGEDGDVVSIEYTGGGTQGAEVVTQPSAFEYVIQIEDGVSTADDIIAAIEASSNPGDIKGTLDYVVTGTGSNPQDVAAQTFLAGGAGAFGGITGLTANVYSRNLSNVGVMNGFKAFLQIGDGTNPIHGGKFYGFSGNTNISQNSDIQNFAVISYGVNSGNNSGILKEMRGVELYGNVRDVGGGVQPFGVNWQIDNALYIESFKTAISVSQDVTQGVNVFVDLSNYSGDIGDNYHGVAIQPDLNSVDSFYGVHISPNITLSRQNSVGINVNMADVDVYLGVKASVTIQDLFVEAILAGADSNGFEIVYVDDGTAGAETISIAFPVITVHMEDGVSTATQIRTALLANISVAGDVNITVTGVGSNPQSVQSGNPLAGGIYAATKKAAYFNGDVQIDGALSFSGALSIGAMSAFFSQALVNSSNPSSVHTLISQPTVANNVTLTSADLLGLNTAMLLNVGSNSTVGTSFIGVSALALPAVISIGAGSTVDKVSGATFALSLDNGAPAGGNIDEVFLCRAIAIPNGGNTTVGRLYGFEMDAPFGPSGTDEWGVYIAPDIQNWVKGKLKIGGVATVSDFTAAGVEFEVEGDSKFNGNIGFYNTAPIVQMASSGAASATATYTSVEQTMIQEMYDALRAYGLLS